MKRVLTVTLQAGISLGLIWWIFRDPTKRAQMATALGEADLVWFLPGLLAVGLALGLQTQRWFILLRAVGIVLPWLRCARLFFIGAFFNLFLLGATGGDVIKILLTVREVRDAKATAFLSVIVDRVVGVLALAIAAIITLLPRLGALMDVPVAKAFLGALALILGGSIGVVVVAVIVAGLRLEHRLPARLPARQTILDLARAITTYAQKPGAVLTALGISVASHLLLFVSFHFAALAFSSKLGLMDTLSVMPIVNTITSLPISFSGVGFREQLFEQLLSALYGAPPAQAVLLSIGGYFMVVFWGLVGGLAYLTYRPPAPATPVPSQQPVAS